MFYERKVKYLDVLVKQEKCGNAGFIKLEARGNVCTIHFHISNLCPTDSKLLKVYFIAAGQETEVCRLDASGGQATKTLMAQPLNQLGGTGITYEQLEAVRIPLSGERELYAQIGQTKDAVVEKVAEREPIHIKPQVQHIAKDEENETEEIEAASATETTTIIEEEKVVEPTVPLCDTKWKQLWQIYPHINPFRDDREYLSLTPGDFVIFPERFFRMANNSFLLHGYYNYKHLILKRMEGYGGVKYYVGVPGNFYDREKQVAVMFGFESFESMEESASAGDYGYYMIRVEL